MDRKTLLAVLADVLAGPGKDDSGADPIGSNSIGKKNYRLISPLAVSLG